MFWIALGSQTAPTETLDNLFRQRLRHAPDFLIIDDALPVFSVRSASELVSNSIAAERFDMFLLAAFATLALTLSVAGL